MKWRWLLAFYLVKYVVLELAKGNPTMNRIMAWDPIGGFVIVLIFIWGTSFMICDAVAPVERYRV